MTRAIHSIEGQHSSELSKQMDAKWQELSSGLVFNWLQVVVAVLLDSDKVTFASRNLGSGRVDVALS